MSPAGRSRQRWYLRAALRARAAFSGNAYEGRRPRPPGREHRRRAFAGQEDGEHRLVGGHGRGTLRHRGGDLLRGRDQGRHEDHDHRVDVRVLAHDLDRAFVLLRGGGRDHVDRVLEAGGGGKERPQFLEGRGGELGKNEALRFAGVGEEDAGTARVGDHTHPGSARRRLGGEEGGHIEHLLERVRADHSRLLEEGVDPDIETGEGRGVRGRGAGARGGAARFHRDDGFAPRHLGREPGEPPRIAEALEVERDDVGARVVLPEREQIVTRDVGLVADRDEGRDADVKVARMVQDGDAQRRRSATASPRSPGAPRSARTSR